MDRSKWEYKKWNEVLTIVNGRDYKEVEAVDGQYPICGSGGEIGKASEYLCPENTVIIGRKGNINKPFFIQEKFWNIDTAFGLVADLSELLPRFLFYFCLYYDFERHNRAVTIPSLTKGDLLKIKMQVPPIADQQLIVVELDCLNEMIALKQEQLKEFDKLAQSIFYDMFGNIESNSKGFKMSQLGKVCQLKAGKAIKAEELHEASEGLYPCFGGNGIRGFIDRFSHEGLFPIIGRQGALCGNINIAKGKFYATEHAVVVTPLVEMDRIWLAFVLQSMHLEKYAHGVAQPGLSVRDLNPLDMIIPPLALQQQFAEKIQAIEAQKELVKKSIAETQQLLDSRMDYYFN